MKKSKIIYDQKFDNKILMFCIIPISLIAIIGMTLFGIIEKIYKDDLSSFLILMFTPIVLSCIALMPCIIIGRYKFVIDTENQLLIYRGYFQRTIKYNLNDINITKRVKVFGNQWHSTVYSVTIFCKDKKVCTIDSKDFELKTNESLLIIFTEKTINR